MHSGTSFRDGVINKQSKKIRLVHISVPFPGTEAFRIPLGPHEDDTVM